MEALAIDWPQFLDADWQRRPRLLRGAAPGFEPPIDGDELAGLALEPDAEARIVERTPAGWRLERGPFTAADFEREHPWTLLVQRVDQWSPAVAALLGAIAPIPQWRVDDVMVSYAADGGSAGPHYDNYDVFLLQGSGRRRWLIGDYCEADCALLPHRELRLLADFDTRESFTLECGDVLYLPPRIAHWGIADGPCTTFSLGLRAPRINDMVARWADRLLETLDDEWFYGDAHLEAAERSGEIRPRDLERARMQVQAALDQMQDDDWFGELVTETGNCEPPDRDGQRAASARLDAVDATVRAAPGARLAWRRDDGALVLYANGARLSCDGAHRAALEGLCRGEVLTGRALAALRATRDGRRLLDACIAQGAIDVD